MEKLVTGKSSNIHYAISDFLREELGREGQKRDLINATSIDMLEDVSERSTLQVPKELHNTVTPEKQLIDAESLGALVAMRDRLGEKRMIMVALYYYFDLSQPEIAKLFGYTTARVSQILASVKQKSGDDDFLD